MSSVTNEAADWQHIANEWADAACNGIQWLKNVRDGISVPDTAIAEMTENVERIRKLVPQIPPAV